MSDELHEVRSRYERLAYRARFVVTEFELRRDTEHMEHAVANLEVELAQGDLGAPRSPLAEAVDEVTELRALFAQSERCRKASIECELALRARCERLERALTVMVNQAVADRAYWGGPPVGPDNYDSDREDGWKAGSNALLLARTALGDARPTMATEAGSSGVAQDLASEEGVS